MLDTGSLWSQSEGLTVLRTATSTQATYPSCRAPPLYLPFCDIVLMPLCSIWFSVDSSIWSSVDDCAYAQMILFLTFDFWGNDSYIMPLARSVLFMLMRD